MGVMSWLRDTTGKIDKVKLVLSLALLLALVALIWLVLANRQSSPTENQAPGNTSNASIPTNITKPAAEQLVRYENNNIGGFSFQYPKSWKKLTCPDVANAVYLAPDQTYLTVCNSDKPSLVGVFSTEGDTRSEKSCADATNDEFRTGTTCKKVSIDGASWLRVEYTTSSASPVLGAGTHIITYSTLAGDWTFVMNYTQPRDYPDEQTNFETMAGSFRFNAE